jgi:hypothetical protein
MYLAAAHDPNDTRHATLRPPSHHHMHAQDGKPGCFRSPYRHRILLGTSNLVAATGSIFYADRTTPFMHCVFRICKHT